MNKIRYIAAAFAGLLVLGGCTTKEFEEVKEISLSRCLAPQDLKATVDVATGDYVTLNWGVNKDAESYNLVISSVEVDENDAIISQTVESELTVLPSEVPYVTRLTADVKYTFKVQACSEKRNPSGWSAYDGYFKTYAVKDNLFLEIAGRSATSVSLKWSAEAEDYTEVSHISASPVKGGDPVEYTLLDADKTAASATVTGLASSTEYQVVLYYKSASRGAVNVWTLPSSAGRTVVSTSDDLKAALTAGSDIYLTLAGSPYEIGGFKPATGFSLTGEIGPDGSRPVVSGGFDLNADTFVGGEDVNITVEGICFADALAHNNLIAYSGGDLTVGSIKFVNCEIGGYKAGVFQANKDNKITIASIAFETCDINGIPGSGGDFFDVRKNAEIGEVVFKHCTIWDGIRTLFRIDGVETVSLGSVNFQNNLVKSVAVMNDGNNRGLFAIRVDYALTLKKNIFLYEDGGVSDEATVDKAQLFQDNAGTKIPTMTAESNYAFAAGKDFFKKVSAVEAGVTVLSEDPCYNSKGNFFQLSDQELISKKAGPSKWWIPFVEKEEDLTQNVLEGAHTWNLMDATLFAGDVKASRVRDELLLAGTNEYPLNADNGILFTGASELTRKGVPTAGYISFKVNTPGSVDLEVADGGASSLVVAILDDNGFAVQGGAMAGGNEQVQKILVPSVTGNADVLIYSTGAITLKKLAWSLDSKGGNRVLATPKPKVEPVTVSESDKHSVTVSWDAVENAASYIVVFNKKSYPAQEELSFTVAGEDIAALKAGLYSFSVQALPASSDIYYIKSEQGSASFAIQPVSSGGEVVEETLVWDFSSEPWQTAFAGYGAANTDITNWNLTVEGLTIVSTAKSKYNTTFFQWGGKGSTSDRYLHFTAPEQGTLKVTASNTGGSEDLTRMVTVNQAGEETSVAGGTASGSPTVCEFSVAAGDVYIYCTGNALRFYSVEFTYSYTTGGGSNPKEPVEYTWDFSEDPWQTAFAGYGAANTDITNWNLTVDGLTIVSAAKSKYNTTFFQWGGKGNTTDRYLLFTAPEQGTLQVTASNTGGSDDLTRMVTVNQAGEETSVAGGTASGSPTVCEFSVAAGEVYIYCTGNALRFYKVHYISQ